MGALVADIAVAGLPEPVPIVMELLAPRGIERRGAAPKVVIHRRRNGLGTGGLADAGAKLVAEGAGYPNFSDVPGGGPLDCLLDGGHGSPLRSGLDDSVEFCPRRQSLLSFPDVVAGGLFDIDILAGHGGPDRQKGVPMIGGGDGNGIDIFVIQYLSAIGFECWAGGGTGRRGDSHGPIQDSGVHVAQSDQALRGWG